MQSRTRRHTPPWERQYGRPRHSTGQARRRWPQAHDGAAPGPRIKRRYQRAFDGDRRAEERRRGVLPRLRSWSDSPIRNGLIGLAVAGTAAPIAVNRYQQALRTDPSHERVATTTGAYGTPLSDQSVTSAWAEMKAASERQRDQVIQENLQEYAEFSLSRDMAEAIVNAAEEANVDPDLAFGLIAAESSFRNSSTSHVGAVGLTQLMPRTATWLEPGVTMSELRDTNTNLRIGLGYLRQLIDKYNGDEDLALTAYNRGPGTVDRILKRGGNPDNGYAGFVRTGDLGSHQG